MNEVKEPKPKRFLSELRKAGLFRYFKAMAVKIPRPDPNYRKGKWARKHQPVQMFHVKKEVEIGKN